MHRCQPAMNAGKQIVSAACVMKCREWRIGSVLHQFAVRSREKPDRFGAVVKMSGHRLSMSTGRQTEHSRSHFAQFRPKSVKQFLRIRCALHGGSSQTTWCRRSRSSSGWFRCGRTGAIAARTGVHQRRRPPIRSGTSCESAMNARFALSDAGATQLRRARCRTHQRHMTEDTRRRDYPPREAHFRRSSYWIVMPRRFTTTP